jgi:hypothetical protein
MKRIIFPLGVILVIFTVALVSYAEWEKIAITKGNLAELKGEWTGSRNTGPGDDHNTDLEISNDSLPVQGKIIFYDLRKGRKVEKMQVRDFKGKINDRGNLYIKGQNNEVELSLYKEDGKMKLEGNFYWSGAKGTMSFKKK